MNLQNQSVFYNFFVIYSLFSISFLINWIRFKYRRPSLYPEDKFISFIVILMITVFWFLALPLYLMKSCSKDKIKD